MTARLGIETANLLIDVARRNREPEEDDQERLLRLASDPLALHVVLNRPARPQALQGLAAVPAQAAIAYCLTPAAGDARFARSKEPSWALRSLGSAAPALVGSPVEIREEAFAPFKPSPEDQRLAIDVVPSGHYLLGMAIAAAVTTAFALWLCA